MSRNVLMVYPEIPSTYWGFKHALSFVDRNAVTPPLGLMTVAALLPEDFRLRLVDMNVRALSERDMGWADMVFLSGMIVQRTSFEHVLSACRRWNKPVVAGGPYPTSSYSQMSGVDHFVLDEAEMTLPVFLRDLEAGRPRRLYRDNRKPDITRTPIPRFDLIDHRAYNIMPLQFSRGCPFNCEFCDIIEMFGRRVRTKSPEQFVREIEAVHKTGYRGTILVVDDNFVGNRARVKPLLRHIIDWQRQAHFPFSFSTEASINLAQDDELLVLMVAAGFKMVFVGIETPDEKTLAFTQKTQNLKAGVLDSVIKIQSRGMEVTGGFILGFDTDPEDIFDRQIHFIQKAGIPLALIGLLTALPNTQLYRRLEQENRLVHASTGNNSYDMKLNFIPRMPQKKLIAGYKRVIREIHSPRRYFHRCLTFLKRLPSSTQPIGRISVAEIKALFRSLFCQTFSYYGATYLCFLFRVILLVHRHFLEAIALAVMGHHFIILTRQILKADALSQLLTRTMASIQHGIKELVIVGGKNLAADLESYVLSIRDSLQKRYSRLSRDVQEYLRDVFAEFETLCEAAIAELRL